MCRVKVIFVWTAKLDRMIIVRAKTGGCRAENVSCLFSKYSSVLCLVFEARTAVFDVDGVLFNLINNFQCLSVSDRGPFCKKRSK